MSKPSNARHERNRLEACSRGRSRGSVLVNTLIALSLIVITLIGTELGYLFFLKREFQKTADLAALAAAQALKPGSCTEATAAAIANAAQNLPTGFTLSASDVTCGRWDPSTRPAQPHFGPLTGSEKYNAVRVTIARTPPLLFPAFPATKRDRSAWKPSRRSAIRWPR